MISAMKWNTWLGPFTALSDKGYRVERDWGATDHWMWCAPGGNWQRDGHTWAGDAQAACETHYRQTGGAPVPMVARDNGPIPVDGDTPGRCLSHFEQPHRYPSGIHAESCGSATMHVPLLDRAYSVQTRKCERCGLQAFLCDCARWLDWPEPYRACTRCGRVWEANSVMERDRNG